MLQTILVCATLSDETADDDKRFRIVPAQIPGYCFDSLLSLPASYVCTILRPSGNQRVAVPLSLPSTYSASTIFCPFSSKSVLMPCCLPVLKLYCWRNWPLGYQ